MHKIRALIQINLRSKRKGNLMKIYQVIIALSYCFAALGMEPVLENPEAIVSKKDHAIYVPDDILNNLATVMCLYCATDSISDEQTRKILKTLGKYFIARSKLSVDCNKRIVDAMGLILEMGKKEFHKNPIENTKRLEFILADPRLKFRNDFIAAGLKKFAATKYALETYPHLCSYEILNSSRFSLAQIDGNMSTHNLEEACESENIDSTKTILENGLPVESKHLIIAVKKNNKELLEVLLKYSDYKLRDNSSSTSALEEALLLGNHEIIQMLKDAAMLRFKPLDSVEKIVRYRSYRFNQHPISTLLDLYGLFGTDVFDAIENVFPAITLDQEIHEAFVLRNIEEIRLRINLLNEKLQSSIVAGKTEQVKELMLLGFIQPNQDSVRCALEGSNKELINILVAHAKNVNGSWLGLAIDKNSVELARLILGFHDLANAPIIFVSQEMHPLEYIFSIHNKCRITSQSGYIENKIGIMLELIKAGAHVDQAFPYGSALKTFLNCEAMTKKHLICLLPYFKDNFERHINDKNRSGNTLLMDLCSNKVKGIWKIKFLLSLGADKHLVNNAHETASVIAERNGNRKTAKLLVGYDNQ